MNRRVLILGAGSSGRGHLGQLAYEAGWDLVFADRNRELVDALREAGRYTVRLCTAQAERTVMVEGFRAYPIGDEEALVREALGALLALTCLFSHNLHQVAPLVARIVAARHAVEVAAPLNVICCENMQHSSSLLRAQVMPLLTPGAAGYAETHVGFPDCMISRVVPLAGADPLALAAEDYNEWTVDATQFLGPPPDLPGMELVANQEARLARKFFMHNGGHAVCAYWGFHHGHTFIHEAVADPAVLAHVIGAMRELAHVVARHYGFSYGEALEYGLELGPRGAIAVLQDRILRVVRDPLRKLARDERLVAPAALAVEDGSPHEELAGAIAAALRYFHAEDPQAVEMRGRLRAEGAGHAIPSFLGLPADHPLVTAVLARYEAWEAPR